MFVDLTGVATARELREPFNVALPPGVMLVQIVPDEGQIIFPPER